MVVEASVLADTLSREFEEFEVSVNNEVVIITENFPAGMWHPSDFESFEKSIQEFIFQYTKDWEIQSTDKNRIEGYHQAILSPNKE